MRHRPIAQDDRAREYRRTTGRIGVTMLVFLALFSGLHYVSDWIAEALLLFMSPKPYAVAVELIDMAAYLLSFMLPVLVYRLLSPKEGRIPMALSPRLPRRLWLVLPAALAVVYCSALANAFLIRALGLAGSSSYPVPEGMQPYEAVLLYMSVAIVPAFCEEFLFRGLILPELLPYGRTTAVLGSAILFGLMHQNFEQMLYATVAGIVLALVAMKCGSIWGGVIIHLFNNLLSVVDEILISRLPYQTEMILYSLMEVLVVGGGMLCLAILIIRRKHTPQRDPDAMVAGPTPAGSALRGFFSPLMIVFWVICVGEMLLWTAINLM
jgi:membrane protease YdiL (CAAX protease family)